MTMDGVLQSPGGASEDPTNGFIWGGWQFGYPEPIVDEALGRIFAQPFDLLLGRRTYEIFSAFWPYQDDAIGEQFNRVHKYVVGTTQIDTSWDNSTQISEDVVNQLKKLKEQDAPDLLVHGSSVLVQTLLTHGLVDELQLMIYPIVLGRGKKLFNEGLPAQEWKMISSQVSNGIIVATYLPGDAVKIGAFDYEPSEAEHARRKRWAEEDAHGK